MMFHGSNMEDHVAEGTTCGKFRIQGSVKHESHEGPVPDVHTKFLSGHDGLHNGLSGIEGMTYMLADVISKGICGDKIILTMSAI